MTDKHQVIQAGGVFNESVEPIEGWLDFLTVPGNLKPGLPKLTVKSSRELGVGAVHVSFSETIASIRTLHLELDCADEVAITVFQESAPHEHHLKDWVFGLFKQTELEYLSVRFLSAELPDMFDHLPKLKNVNLYRSKLVRLPPSFYRLPALAHLVITESGFPEVPFEITRIKSLRSLAFSQPCSPSVLGGLKGLTHLTCHCNQYNVPAEITQLIDLEQLTLSDVASAPDDFLAFPKLSYLYFHVNKKHTAFNFDQAKVPSLRKLLTNYPSAFAASIAHSKKLEHFAAGDNFNFLLEPLTKSELDTLTKSLQQLASLTHLTLRSLGITDVSFCLPLTRLKTLDLSGNAIVHVPSDLNELFASGSLNLKDNPIVDFPNLNFKDEIKQRLIVKGGAHKTEEPFIDWLTFLTNPLNLRPGLPDLEISTDLIYFEDGYIRVSFDKDKPSLRSLQLILPPIDEMNVALFQDEPKWIFNLFLNTELEELEVPFQNAELPDQFDKLSKLNTVNLAGSKIVKLPASILQRPELKIQNFINR